MDFEKTELARFFACVPARPACAKATAGKNLTSK